MDATLRWLLISVGKSAEVAQIEAAEAAAAAAPPPPPVSGLPDTSTWISPDAPAYVPLPEGSLPGIEARDRIVPSWSRENMLVASSAVGFAPTYAQERASQALPVKAAPVVQMTRQVEGLSTPVMVGIGAVVVVGLGAVVYKVRKSRR